jgi:hypothetical protein
LNQKVRGMDRMFGFHPAQTTIPPVSFGQAEPKSSC